MFCLRVDLPHASCMCLVYRPVWLSHVANDQGLHSMSSSLNSKIVLKPSNKLEILLPEGKLTNPQINL